MRALNKRVDGMDNHMDKRMDDMNKRIDGLDNHMNKRMDDMNNHMNKRMDGLEGEVRGINEFLRRDSDKDSEKNKES